MVKKGEWCNGALENLLSQTYREGLKVHAYHPGTNKIYEIELSSYLDALKLKLRGFVKPDERQYEGWSNSVPLYLYTDKIKTSAGKKRAVFIIAEPYKVYCPHFY
jgi:hypothetical protein